MKTKAEKLVFFSYVLLSIAVCGCGQKDYDKHYYVLETERRGPLLKELPQDVLDLRRFTIASAYKSRELVYRTADHEYKTDFYHELLTSPAVMITDKTRQWLSRSGLFKAVVDSASNAEANYILEASITKLYGDFRPDVQAGAVMEIRFFLLDEKNPDQAIILTKKYKKSVPLRTKEPESLVRALDKCLEEILMSLEKDLQQKLGTVE
ncbi:MAG: ABC-type transport auxiliary lipoprotein family protein [Planctomycetota bacterium]|jgi:cholesterol transport system auxiliary component